MKSTFRYFAVLGIGMIGLAGCEDYPHNGPDVGYSDLNKSGTDTYGGTNVAEGPKDPAGKLAPEIKNAKPDGNAQLRAPSGQGPTPSPGTGTYGGSSTGGGTPGPGGSNPASGNSR